MRPRQRIRLSLNLSEDAHRRLQLLFQMTEAESQTEVIRKALVLYEIVLKMHQERKLPAGLQLP